LSNLGIKLVLAPLIIEFLVGLPFDFVYFTSPYTPANWINNPPLLPGGGYTQMGLLWNQCNGEITCLLFNSLVSGSALTSLDFIAQLSAIVGAGILIILMFGLTIGLPFGIQFGASNPQGTKLAQIVGLSLFIWGLGQSWGGWVFAYFPSPFSSLLPLTFTLMQIVGVIMWSQEWS
jgi:hypothetical protein